eukprot:11339_1
MTSSAIDNAHTKMDQLLFDIAKDEKTAFMCPKPYDQAVIKIAQNPHPLGLPSPLPALMTFLNPKRYLVSIKGYKPHNIAITNDEQKQNNFKVVSCCQEVSGIMQYLSMSALINGDYLTFYKNNETGQKAKKK